VPASRAEQSRSEQGRSDQIGSDQTRPATACTAGVRHSSTRPGSARPIAAEGSSFLFRSLLCPLLRPAPPLPIDKLAVSAAAARSCPWRQTRACICLRLRPHCSCITVARVFPNQRPYSPPVSLLLLFFSSRRRFLLPLLFGPPRFSSRSPRYARP
jgi:hypothetical protein